MANILSGKTKNIDKTARMLADQFKMTDIKTVREGESQPPRHNPGNVSWGKPGNFPLDGIQSVAGERTGLMPNRDAKFGQVRPSSEIRDHENLKITPDMLKK